MYADLLATLADSTLQSRYHALREADRLAEMTSLSEELRQRKWLDQIIVGAEIQTKNAIVDTVPGRKDQHRRFDVTLPECVQDFEPAPARQHQIENNEVEQLSVGAKEPVFAGMCHDHVVVLRLQGRRDNLRQLALVFDNENPHYVEMVSICAGSDPDFSVREPFPSNGIDRSASNEPIPAGSTPSKP